MITATGCGLSVPPLGAHHGPPLGGISNTTSSGRSCLLATVDNLDMTYINTWVRKLGLGQIYKEAEDARHAS